MCQALREELGHLPSQLTYYQVTQLLFCRITPVLQMRKQNPRVAAELSRVTCLAHSRQREGTWSWHLGHEKGTRFLKCRDKRGLPCVRL